MLFRVHCHSGPDNRCSARGDFRQSVLGEHTARELRTEYPAGAHSMASTQAAGGFRVRVRVRVRVRLCN